jgi:hypothetical protein
MPGRRSGVGRRFGPRSATRGPVDLDSMRAEALLKARSTPLGPTSPSACSSATKAFEAALRSYEDLGRDRQRNWGYFSGMFRGVSNPREGSKILTYLFRPSTGVQLAPISPKL